MSRLSRSSYRGALRPTRTAGVFEVPVFLIYTQNFPQNSRHKHHTDCYWRSLFIAHSAARFLALRRLFASEWYLLRSTEIKSTVNWKRSIYLNRAPDTPIRNAFVRVSGLLAKSSYNSANAERLVNHVVSYLKYVLRTPSNQTNPITRTHPHIKQFIYVSCSKVSNLVKLILLPKLILSTFGQKLNGDASIYVSTTLFRSRIACEFTKLLRLSRYVHLYVERWRTRWQIESRLCMASILFGCSGGTGFFVCICWMYLCLCFVVSLWLNLQFSIVPNLSA